jgi:Xaa-Pro aminopeptidase
MPVALYSHLARRLPDIKLIDAGKSFAEIRAAKSQDEIEVIERAARLTHQAALDAMAASRLGETERTMANRIAEGIVNGGADRLSHIIFTSGDRSSHSHGFPTGRVPLKSEIIRFDIGGRYGAWNSDFARTYSTGEPTQLQRETYGKLWEIYTSTIEMFRPEMPAEEPFLFYTEQVKKVGLNSQLWLGHSLGVENHEYPMIRPGEKAKIEVGMVFNIEPYVRDPSGVTYEFEDTFVITEKGARLLTLGFPPREIPIIGERI